MKMSLQKLRGLGLNKADKRERRLQHSLAQLDELAQASQDMQDMKDCYESLLSAAAATTNSAYEFSESLREMGDCLLEKTALNDDEESGKVLLMLGKVQLEIQNLVDSYRSHISQTITVPSESLLNELRVVEEMKNQCDDKRKVYDHMMGRYKERGRLRNNTGEFFSSHQLKAAHDEYDDHATIFVFRMKSLKQGQSLSLLTQASRHHASQLCFFKKALKSLEAIEPHVKLVTEQQHIDYHFSGLDDDNNDDDEDEDGEDESEVPSDGRLSFDYGQNDQGQVVYEPSNSMELDSAELTFPQATAVDTAKENLDRKPAGHSLTLGQGLKTGSNSAPLFAEVKADPTEQFSQTRPVSTRKLHTYVLPMPVSTKTPVSTIPNAQIPQLRQTSPSVGPVNLWHSSPLEQGRYGKILRNEKLSRPIFPNSVSVLKESNNNVKSSRLPPPLTDGLSLPQVNPYAASDAKKIKRQAFSGPIMSKSSPNRPSLTASGPIASTGRPYQFSGSILHAPMTPPASLSKLSPSVSPTFASPPKISELHELPRPPLHLASKKSSNPVGHSSPLELRSQQLSAAESLVGSDTASTLPKPPQTLSRSYSIPSSSQREIGLHSLKQLQGPEDMKMVEAIPSPPLTPISLSNI